MALKPGIMGYLSFASNNFWFSDSSIGYQQDMILPDLLQGNYDRVAWATGQRLITGTISGPVGAGLSIWATAIERDSCGICTTGDAVLFFNCDDQWGISDLKINSCTLSVAAGDIANFTADFIGKDDTASTGSWAELTYGTDCSEILSWKDCGISGASGDLDNISAFEISVANNITPYFKLGSGVFPTVLIEGIRTVTGSISYYGPPGSITIPSSALDFNFGASTITLDRVVTTGQVPAASPGLTVTTENFTGVCEWDSATV